MQGVSLVIGANTPGLRMLSKADDHSLMIQQLWLQEGGQLDAVRFKDWEDGGRGLHMSQG